MTQHEYKPTPLYCVDCGAVVGIITSGWVRSGKAGAPGEPDIVEGWRPAAQEDFPGIRCEACGLASLGNIPLQELLGVPAEGFKDLDSFAMSAPPPLRVECRNTQLPPLEPTPEDEELIDGDMEAAGVADWTARSSPTLTKGDTDGI